MSDSNESDQLRPKEVSLSVDLQDYLASPSSTSFSKVVKAMYDQVYPGDQLIAESFSRQYELDYHGTALGSSGHDENDEIVRNPLVPLSKFPEVKALIVQAVASKDPQKKYLSEFAAFSDDSEVHAAILAAFTGMPLKDQGEEEYLDSMETLFNQVEQALFYHRESPQANPLAKNTLLSMWQALVPGSSYREELKQKGKDYDSEVEQFRQYMVGHFTMAQTGNGELLYEPELLAKVVEYFKEKIDKRTIRDSQHHFLILADFASEAKAPYYKEIANMVFKNQPENLQLVEKYLTTLEESDFESVVEKQITDELAVKDQTDSKRFSYIADYISMYPIHPHKINQFLIDMLSKDELPNRVKNSILAKLDSGIPDFEFAKNDQQRREVLRSMISILSLIDVEKDEAAFRSMHYSAMIILKRYYSLDFLESLPKEDIENIESFARNDPYIKLSPGWFDEEQYAIWKKSSSANTEGHLYWLMRYRKEQKASNNIH